MGCSPSKGNNLGTLGSLRRGRMLPPVPQEQPRAVHFIDGANHTSAGSTDEDTKARKTSGQKQLCQKDEHLPPAQVDTYVTVPSPEVLNTNKMKSHKIDNSNMIQKKEKNGDKQEVTERKAGKKTKRNSRGMKVLKKKDKEMQKIDFPEPLVKAHQAAYAFLNPSINKYDGVLGLLEQAMQTQAFLQPMVSFLALRYEEIIQVLEEIVDEGEKMLKENGEHLAWPSQMKNLSSSAPLKSGSAIEPPPDLLQQLLQYTTQRMQNVNQTVGGIGDSALEEAVEYFSSVSELLEEKLKVKREVETRIMRLSSRIELASLRKLGPEDSALFSEDSGIGAESESLAGSERRHRRVSCESSGTSRTTPVSPMAYSSSTGVARKKHACQISPSVSLTSLNSLASMCTMMANAQGESLLGSVSLDDGEEDDDGNNVVGDIGNRQHRQQKPLRLPSNRIENPKNVEMTIKMKNAISGKIQFHQPTSTGAKSKVAGCPKAVGGHLTDEKGLSLKRSQTVRRAVVKANPVVKERRSRSVESLRSKGEDPTLLELEKSQKNLSQRLQKIAKSKENIKGTTKTTPSKQNHRNSPAESPKINRKHPSLEKDGNLRDRAALTKSITKCQEAATNIEKDDNQKDKTTLMGPVKAMPPPSPPVSPRPSSSLYKGRNSVKKLIDTFSQGIEELDSPDILGPLRGVRKCGVPVLPGLGNVTAFLSNGKTSCRPDRTPCEKTDYLDLDSLPPPPLEVLMDNSFESAQSLAAGVTDDGTIKPVKSQMVKRAGLSQRLRASVQSVPVLPSKGGVPQCTKTICPAKGDHQVTTNQTNVSQPDVQADVDSVKETNSTLLLQIRKNRYLKHSSDAQFGKSFKNSEVTSQSTSQQDSTNVQADDNFLMPEVNTTVSEVPPSSAAGRHSLATPPLSKGRMLPSTPSTSRTSHRRLPSPHSFKKPPTPPSSASPPVNRKLTTPPEGHKRLPSPPIMKQNILNSNVSSSYPFKAPSPPASPKVQRWTSESSTEDSSRLFSNARSVFCPISPSLFEAQPCTAPQTTQAWASAEGSSLSRTCGNRGRFLVFIPGPRPFIQRSHSERRPSLNLPPESPGFLVAETCGSEPVICTQGLDDEPTREEESWGSQSNLRATPRSASHPDLCVVGQALYRD
ncbi:photoreceptor cilium actin regulator [Dunckerocampus dactyliophorus]|uniref:photoreceptor cilium actin regulator n=1 Tax=Dunckerocampus dactyliophorus TaxID=161453 RepID=UPI0024062CF3|nr:photoreceptor cilium actin regulator [Dunckerocampus dactyliophorus]